MFWLIFLLLVAGLILILLEAVVPHGLSMIAGLIVIGFSLYVAVRQDWSPQLTALYMVLALVFASGTAWLTLRSGVGLIALRPPGGTAVAEGPNVGEELQVIQPLRPTGSVLWQGRRLAARSLRPEVETPVGQSVVLRDRDSIYLLVEPLSRPTEGRPGEPPHPDPAATPAAASEAPAPGVVSG